MNYAATQLLGVAWSGHQWGFDLNLASRTGFRLAALSICCHHDTAFNAEFQAWLIAMYMTLPSGKGTQLNMNRPAAVIGDSWGLAIEGHQLTDRSRQLH